MSTMDPNYNRAVGIPPDYYELEKVVAQLRAENDALAGKVVVYHQWLDRYRRSLQAEPSASYDAELEYCEDYIDKLLTDPTPAIESLLRNRARLKSIHDNGLCQEWLNECNVPRSTWGQFLELVDQQIEMDGNETRAIAAQEQAHEKCMCRIVDEPQFASQRTERCAWCMENQAIADKAREALGCEYRQIEFWRYVTDILQSEQAQEEVEA